MRGDDRAFPNHNSDELGLTKREWMATTILAGMMTSPRFYELTNTAMVLQTVEMTDLLLKEVQR